VAPPAIARAVESRKSLQALPKDVCNYIAREINGFSEAVHAIDPVLKDLIIPAIVRASAEEQNQKPFS